MLARLFNHLNQPPKGHLSPIGRAATRTTKRQLGRATQFADSQQRSDSEPIAVRTRVGAKMQLDAATHAAALLELLQDADYPTGYQLNFQELGKVYREMCTQNGWRPRGWISVGRAFDLLTTRGAKPYANFWGEDGRAQRLRVYPIPAKQSLSVLRVA